MERRSLCTIGHALHAIATMSRQTKLVNRIGQLQTFSKQKNNEKNSSESSAVFFFFGFWLCLRVQLKHVQIVFFLFIFLMESESMIGDGFLVF